MTNKPRQHNHPATLFILSPRLSDGASTTTHQAASTQSARAFHDQTGPPALTSADQGFPTDRAHIGSRPTPPLGSRP